MSNKISNISFVFILLFFSGIYGNNLKINTTNAYLPSDISVFAQLEANSTASSRYTIPDFELTKQLMENEMKDLLAYDVSQMGYDCYGVYVLMSKYEAALTLSSSFEQTKVTEQIADMTKLKNQVTRIKTALHKVLEKKNIKLTSFLQMGSLFGDSFTSELERIKKFKLRTLSGKNVFENLALAIAEICFKTPEDIVTNYKPTIETLDFILNEIDTINSNLNYVATVYKKTEISTVIKQKVKFLGHIKDKCDKENNTVTKCINVTTGEVVDINDTEIPECTYKNGKIWHYQEVQCVLFAHFEFFNYFHPLKGYDSYGFVMWFRWRTFYPTLAPKSERYTIARLTEHKGHSLTDKDKPGDRNLAVFLTADNLEFCTYTKHNVSDCQIHPHHFEHEDGWAFIHMAYSWSMKRAIAHLRLNNKTHQFDWYNVEHKKHPPYLQLIYGNDSIHPGMNGHYANINFFRCQFQTDVSFLIDQFPLPSESNFVEPLKTVITANRTYRLTDNTMGLSTKLRHHGGGKEYAAYGWFKWDDKFMKNTRQLWHMVYRVSLRPNTIPYEKYKVRVADRILSLWLHEANALCYTTYIFTTRNVTYNKCFLFRYEDFNNKWVFSYFGASLHKQYAIAFTKSEKFGNRADFPELRHYVPGDYIEITLSRDIYFRKTGFAGYMGPYWFGTGEGAFKHQGADILQLIKDTRDKVLKDKNEKIIEIIKYTDTKAEENNKLTELKGNDANDLWSYGFAGWTRYHTYYPTKIKKDYKYYFFGSITLNEEHGHGSKVGDRGIGLEIGYNAFKVSTHTGDKPLIYQEFEHKSDIEDAWIFVYCGYHYFKKKVQCFFDLPLKSMQVQITNVYQIYETSYLGFFLGGDNGNSPSINGEYANVNFFRDMFWDTDLAKLPKKWKLPPIAKESLNLISKTLLPETLETKETTVIPPLIYTDLGGAREYCIYGWFKWNSRQMVNDEKTWYMAYRMTINPTNENRDGKVSMGDRVLSLWRRAPETLVFTTYSRTLNKTQYAFYVDNDKKYMFENRWIFTYFGVDLDERKAYVYVKYENKFVKLEEPDATQFVPGDYIEVNVNQDKFTKDQSFVGYHGPYRFDVGDGSVKKRDYKNLMNTNTHAFVEDPSKKYKIKDLANSLTKDSVMKEFTNDEFTKTSSYGFALWVRPRTYFPSRMPDKKKYSYARLTSNQNFKDKDEPGDRALYVGINDGKYIACTYTDSDPNKCVDVTSTNHNENTWIFIYMSYSVLQRKVIVYFAFPYVKIPIEMKNIHHSYSTSYFAFVLGKDGYNQGINGQIGNVNVFRGYFWKENFVKLALNEFPLPAIVTTPAFVEVPLIKDSRHTTEKTEGVTSIYKNLGGITEYSIYGWFRWDSSKLQDTQKQWHMAYRMTLNPTKKKEDYKHFSLADRVLSLWIKSNKSLCFTTYNISSNSPISSQCVPFRTYQFEKEWVFTWFGIKHDTNQTIACVYFNDDKPRASFTPITQYVPGDYIEITVGPDNYYKNLGFAGVIGPYYFSHGSGSFISDPVAMDEFVSTKTHGTVQGNTKKMYKIADHEAVTEDKTIDKEFTSGEFDNAESYGVSFWFRLRQYYPKKLNEFGGVYSLFRFTINKENSDNKEGDKTLAASYQQSLTEIKFKFETYSTVNNQLDLNQVMNIPLDFENQWAFLYLGYSHVKHEVIAYIGTSKGNEEELFFTDVIHKKPNGYSKIIFGKDPANKRLGFHGEIANFYLTRSYYYYNHFSVVRNQTFALPEHGFDRYQFKRVTVFPKPMHMERSENGTTNIYTDLGGRCEYAFHGWVEFDEGALINKRNQEWYMVYRVSINPNDLTIHNYKAIRQGDRVFSVWIYNTTDFCFISYTRKKANEDVVYSCEQIPKNIIENNFIFSYFGINICEKTAHYHLQNGNLIRYKTLAANHFIPGDFIQVAVSRDKYFLNSGIQGNVGPWFLDSGPGAYKNTDIQKIIDETKP